MAAKGPQLRERIRPSASDGMRVRIEDPTPIRRRVFQEQRERIMKFQRRWEHTKTDLPPQLSRKHIGMISIGGVIGTGLFLGSADALRNGGPVGALLGYSIVGTVVYCLCVSIGEMIAFLPNVGGVVGIADLYVDPALGFSLGWAAWYNWSVTLPAEISAAAVVADYWKDHNCKDPWKDPNCEDQMLSWKIVVSLSAVFLFIATIINCFPSRIYGEMEYRLSCLKVITIAIVIILLMIIDLGGSSEGRIGFQNWKSLPFGEGYLKIEGAKGRFLGFWAVLMQASFSFFGSDCPGIAAGEVIDATRNVPRALRKVWIRITLFYIGGVLSSGLIVPANNPSLGLDDQTGRSSPFVIAFKIAGWKVLPDLVNATILLSAWSAAVSDIYIGSRFLFFLARRGHAPAFLAHLFRYPRPRRVRSRQEDSLLSAVDDSSASASEHDFSDSDGGASTDVDSDSASARPLGLPPPAPLQARAQARAQPTYVMPIASVIVSASVGCLTFLSYHSGGAAMVFSWLVRVASVASLQSWAAMLFTYIRWHQGTVYYERKYKDQDTPEAVEARAQIAQIKKARQWGQPYLAWYAFALCIIVLLTNGWAVFVHREWRIADVFESPKYTSEEKLSDPVSIFLSAYVPLPFFVLLTFGYKLINQTEMIPLDKMTFDRGKVPPMRPDEPEPDGWMERVLRWLTVI